ncbi:Creatinase/aminopeptidase [Tricholoma matsutake]|nr:Creatinase/aminopeptidase [Tricholoma matsutake 945]
MVYPARKHVLKTFESLIELLPMSEKTKPQVLILAGEVTGYRHDTDRELVFRQESNFYYLSGCTIPSSYLLIAYQPGKSLLQTPTVELFIPKAELADLMWSVPPPSLEDASETHDVTRVDHSSTLPAAIDTLIATLPGALFHTLPRGSPLFPVLPDEYTRPVLAPENEGGAVTDLYLLPALQRARLTKDEDEIAAIKHANQISSRAHEVVMRVLGMAVKGGLQKAAAAAAGKDRPLLPGEWLISKEAEAEAVFVASCRREGAVHQAYLPIVAASTRASTLHYCCNDREFAWGPVHPHDHQNKNEFAHRGTREFHPQVLLIDAGCEWDCYASDITRTMPVGNGGKFTSEARAIYELVLEMQKASFDILQPGLHWDAVQLSCHRTLVRGFQRLGIFHSPNSLGSGSWNSEEAILASGVSSAFFPHGVGHSLGMDVHDVPSASKPAVNDSIKTISGHPSFYDFLRLRLPLEAGMVVTVEPGIYFSPHLLSPVRDSKHINHEVLKRYEGVGGVRIEDVVLITATGYENLTTVRSDTAWVEALCSGEVPS